MPDAGAPGGSLRFSCHPWVHGRTGNTEGTEYDEDTEDEGPDSSGLKRIGWRVAVTRRRKGAQGQPVNGVYPVLGALGGKGKRKSRLHARFLRRSPRGLPCPVSTVALGFTDRADFFSGIDA